MIDRVDSRLMTRACLELRRRDVNGGSWEPPGQCPQVFRDIREQSGISDDPAWFGVVEAIVRRWAVHRIGLCAEAALQHETPEEERADGDSH